jgi:RND superfamily putative drug exporter
MTESSSLLAATVPPGGRLARTAAWSQRHRWLVVTGWLVALAVITAMAQVVGPAYRSDVSLPGTQSQAVVEALDRLAPDRSGDSAQIVLQSAAGLTDRGVETQVEHMLAQVRELPHVVDVSDPYTDGRSLSEDGTIGYAAVQFDAAGPDLPADAVRAVVETAEGAGTDTLVVALGGDPVRAVTGESGGAAEGLGLLAALVILVVMFGSLLAATLPLLTAVFAVGSAIGGIALVSHLVTVPSYVAPLMILVGLGVGIDYALLVFSRYRSQITGGHDRHTATQVAFDTAGRSVLFAGLTVMIALLGMLVLGLGSLQGIALAVAVTVLITMAASLTLLPALLAVFGRRIERSIRQRALRRPPAESNRWARWSAAIQRRPLPAILLGTVVLIALAAPAMGMRLGIADAGTDAAGDTTRTAYDLLAEGFGPGVNGPLVVVAEGASDVTAAGRTLAAVPGVASVSPPQPLQGTDTALLFVVPETGPQDAATDRLVTDLRDRAVPNLENDLGGEFLVGGSPAAADDFAAAVADRLPWFVLAVVGLSAMLLLVVFRSIAIPVKAAVLNLLSIGAALGVVTAVFQNGLFGASSGPVEAFVPVLIFAIVFGLSMDYEVFLISRMHEEWRRTGEAQRAFREGMARTGSVITAAASIMIVVFGAFLLSPDRMLQQFGLGLAVAVLVDALIIRCLVVPAVMGLLDRRAWWLPAALGRRLPVVHLEGAVPLAEPERTPLGTPPAGR